MGDTAHSGKPGPAWRIAKTNENFEDIKEGLYSYDIIKSFTFESEEEWWNNGQLGYSGFAIGIYKAGNSIF